MISRFPVFGATLSVVAASVAHVGHGRPPFRRRQRAFTLAELIVSSAAAAVLMGGLASVMVITSRALPRDRTQLESLADTSLISEQMTSELASALSFTENTATAVTFTVPDRNADTLPETIRYSWSGTAGDPLYRQYNGGTSVAVLTDVRVFCLSYDTYTKNVTTTPTETESAETLLSSYDSTANLAERSITTLVWEAQVFKPVLPAEAVCWRLTKVKFQLKRDGSYADGQFAVQVRFLSSSNKPTSDIYATANGIESDLGTAYTLRTYTLVASPPIAPNKPVGILVRGVANDPSCKIRYRSSGVTDTSLARVETTNGSSSWSVMTAQSMLFEAWGTVTTLTAATTSTKTYVAGVHVSARTGTDDVRRVETQVQVVNQPEITDAAAAVAAAANASAQGQAQAAANAAAQAQANGAAQSVVAGP